jgi:hypothetical protein
MCRYFVQITSMKLGHDPHLSAMVILDGIHWHFISLKIHSGASHDFLAAHS